jgi:hypothetical protein
MSVQFILTKSYQGMVFFLKGKYVFLQIFAIEKIELVRYY